MKMLLLLLSLRSLSHFLFNWLSHKTRIGIITIVFILNCWIWNFICHSRSVFFLLSFQKKTLFYRSNHQHYNKPTICQMNKLQILSFYNRGKNNDNTKENEKHERISREKKEHTSMKRENPNFFCDILWFRWHLTGSHLITA